MKKLLLLILFSQITLVLFCQTLIFDIPASASHLSSSNSTLDWKLDFRGTQCFCHSSCSLSDCFLDSPLYNDIPSAETNTDIEISPNPFSHQISVVLNSFVKETYTVRLYNLQGNCIYEQISQKASSTHSFDAIPRGAYILEILFDNKNSIRKKLIKQ